MRRQTREMRFKFAEPYQIMIARAALGRLDLGQFTSSRLDSVYKETVLLICAGIAGIALSAAILGREYRAMRDRSPHPPPRPA